MEHLERPDELEWDERRLWFEEREAGFASGGAGDLSEQACALMIDLQAAYCAGAWSAVVILAAAIVDAQSLYSGFRGDGLSEERAWLRNLRNRLLHEDRSDPVLTIEDQWTKRDEWQRKAKRAIEVALRVVYGEQGGSLANAKT